MAPFHIQSRHKQWRRECKKNRRRKKRQAAAQERDRELAERQPPESPEARRLRLAAEAEQELLLVEVEQRQRDEAERRWLHREWLAQQEFQARLALKRPPTPPAAEAAAATDEEETRPPSARARDVRREQLDAYLSTEDETLPDFLTADPNAEQDPREPCPFFSRTGACRFGDLCSRKHAHPLVSRTLLVPAFYQHYGLDKAFRDEFSSDGHLEFEDSEIYEHFREFYADVRAELASTGGLRQLLVCCNGQAHLRGNVYVEFAGPKEAVRAFLRLHGRWYDGRQLTCRFVDIPSWRAAICGLFNRGRCPKGRLCNFLHVFRDPQGASATGDAAVAAPAPAASKSLGRWSESPPPVAAARSSSRSPRRRSRSPRRRSRPSRWSRSSKSDRERR